MSADDQSGSTTAAATLIELLEERASAPRGGYEFLQDGNKLAADLSYPDLAHQARAIAAQLQQQVPFGSRALLLYPPGLSFLSGFFGCLYAGVVAVPVPPPDSARLKRTLPRLGSAHYRHDSQRITRMLEERLAISAMASYGYR